MSKITVQHYKTAYAYGVRDAKTGGLTGWRTGSLQAAHEMGMEGISINWDKIVIGERYGDLPETGRSFNYADNTAEFGVSLSNIKGEKEIGSSMWFSDRKKVEVRGILLPVTGSDGEPLILPLDIDQYDF